MVVVNMGSAGVALDKKSGKVVWVSGQERRGLCYAGAADDWGDRCLASCPGNRWWR